MAELLRVNQSAFNPPTASTPCKASPVTLGLPHARGCSPGSHPRGGHDLNHPQRHPAPTNQQQWAPAHEPGALQHTGGALSPLGS